MTSVAQLGYLGLSVSNVDEWERFAGQILGLQANGRDADGSLFLRIDEYHHRFIVHPTGKDDLAYIGWEVPTEEALQTIAAQLTTAGVTIQPGTSEEAEARRVAGLIKFHDPSGIASEIFYGPLVTFEKPFQSPRPITASRPRAKDWATLCMFVDDLDRSLHFYRDVLGMRISDFVNFSPAPGVKLKIAFLHCNPRHHSLAFAAMPQAPKRLHHFMLQANSLDDVGSTYYLCQNQQVPIVMNLGKHTNDHMVSFYLRTPSGFAIEYGWGAREVDDRTWQVQVHTSGSIWGHQGHL